MLRARMLLTDAPNLPLVIGLPVALLLAIAAITIGMIVGLGRVRRQ